jgi:hypothetical protein
VIREIGYREKRMGLVGMPLSMLMCTFVLRTRYLGGTRRPWSVSPQFPATGITRVQEVQIREFRPQSIELKRGMFRERRSGSCRSVDCGFELRNWRRCWSYALDVQPKWAGNNDKHQSQIPVVLS